MLRVSTSLCGHHGIRCLGVGSSDTQPHSKQQTHHLVPVDWPSCMGGCSYMQAHSRTCGSWFSSPPHPPGLAAHAITGWTTKSALVPI